MRLNTMIDVVSTEGGLEDLRRCYDAHASMLLRLAVALLGRRAGAEDLVHDAFLRLHRSPRPPGPGREAAYLRRTVTNLANDSFRRAEVARRLAPERRPDTASAESTALAGQRSQRIAAAVAELPERQRACVALHYFADRSDSQVAAELGITVGSVKTHLHRARARLADSLEDLR